MTVDESVSWFHMGKLATRGAPAVLGLVGGLLLLLAGTAGADPESVVLGMLLLAAGVLGGVSCLLLVVNSTRVHTDGDVLRVRHGPLPWVPGPELRRSEILQFTVIPSGTDFTWMSRGRRGRPHMGPPSPASGARGVEHSRNEAAWSIEAVLPRGQLEEVVSGIEERARADQILQRLEAWHRGG